METVARGDRARRRALSVGDAGPSSPAAVGDGSCRAVTVTELSVAVSSSARSAADASAKAAHDRAGGRARGGWCGGRGVGCRRRGGRASALAPAPRAPESAPELVGSRRGTSECVQGHGRVIPPPVCVIPRIPDRVLRGRASGGRGTARAAAGRAVRVDVSVSTLDGVDAAAKLAILCALAFGLHVKPRRTAQRQYGNHCGYRNDRQNHQHFDQREPVRAHRQLQALHGIT